VALVDEFPHTNARIAAPEALEDIQVLLTRAST
jgi:hypothetical protein